MTVFPLRKVFPVAVISMLLVVLVPKFQIKSLFCHRKPVSVRLIPWIDRGWIYFSCQVLDRARLSSSVALSIEISCQWMLTRLFDWPSARNVLSRVYWWPHIVLVTHLPDSFMWTFCHSDVMLTRLSWEVTTKFRFTRRKLHSSAFYCFKGPWRCSSDVRHISGHFVSLLYLNFKMININIMYCFIHNLQQHYLKLLKWSSPYSDNIKKLLGCYSINPIM